MSTVVHVGFPKVASTALQRSILPALAKDLPSCAVVTPDVPRFDALSIKLAHGEDNEYRPDLFRAFLREARGEAETLILSQERLSGALFRRGYNRERNAARLHDLVPEAKIVVLVRSQATMLRSIYSQYVHNGGSAALQRFFYEPLEGCDIDLDHLCFDRCVDHYESLFGKKRVLVLPYELLTTSCRLFVTELLSFIAPELASRKETELPQRTANKSLSRPSRWLMRHSSHFFLRSQYNREPLLPLGETTQMRHFLQHVIDPLVFRMTIGRSRMQADDPVPSDILTRYEPSNQRLQRLTGLPLGALGYPLPARESAVSKSA